MSFNLYDYDRVQETMFVRQGKGRKDRMLPIGERAQQWLEKYLLDSRPCLLNGQVSEALFVSSRARRLGTATLGHLITRYLKASGFERGGNCHLFRHAMATQMLENGADVRFVQEMLGHQDLSTTHVYTKVSIGKLKEVHRATHPARLD